MSKLSITLSIPQLKEIFDTSLSIWQGHEEKVCYDIPHNSTL